MTLTKNFEYQGPDRPTFSVVPPEWNSDIYYRELNATADVADKITAGILVYLTGTTNASDMTQVAATYGKDSQGGKLYITQCREHDIYFPTTVSKPHFPNRLPNTTATLTDYTHGANRSIIVIPVEKGMKLWCLGSVNGTWDTTFNTEYIPATDGFIGAVGDVDGVVIDEVAHKFRSCATTLNQNWSFMEYLGKFAHDKST